MVPSSPLIAALQAVVVASLALCLGRLVVDAIAGHRELDRVTRWALALPGLALISFLMMLLHIVTGGAIFSNPWLTRILTVAIAALLLVYKISRGLWPRWPRVPRSQTMILAAALIVGVVVWGSPIVRILPLNFTPDTNLHMGWASELMLGESTPSTVITGRVPGSYPWLYHGLVALLAPFTPGGRAFDTLDSLQLLQVVGVILALFALGVRMTGRTITGAAAAFFGALSGGFGIGLLFDARLRADAASMGGTKISWLGDILSRRPYEFAFNNIAPAYPRDLSFALLAAFLLLLILGLRARSIASLAAAGVVLGLAGLFGGESVIVGILVGTVVCLLQSEMPPIRAALALLVPTILVWGPWLAPLIANYVRYGGFVNTTHVGVVVLTFPFLMLSWGLTTPFALLGAGASLRAWRSPSVLTALALFVITILIIASNNVLSAASGGAFLTLGRDHRYWGLCQLGVALFAALGATVLWEWLQRYRMTGAAIAAVVVALGVVSPALGSAIYPDREPVNQVIRDSLEGRPTLLNALAPVPGRRCVAAVQGNLLAREVFAYTGYRLVQWLSFPGRPNDARIRWRAIYHYIPGEEERLKDNRVLTEGLGSSRHWKSVVRKYGVDFVVVPRDRSGSPVFAGYEKQEFRLPQAAVTLVTVHRC